MTAPANSALFISYASQDAEAAGRICEALRAGGIEVWFDQSELRGGDAWDRQIRQQIHDCRLFMPVISAGSESRDEGYFRREWKLAVDRTHDMADRRAFLVPVVIDDTPERGASVPDKFLELQWTHLPGGETPPAFVNRVRQLLLGEASTPIRTSANARVQTSPFSRTKRALPVVVAGAVVAAALALLGHFWLERLHGSRSSVEGQSIAVLPLANESGDPAQQYFSDGISEDLITALTQLRGLKVIGRTSSFQFRDSKEDSRGIGAKLGVARLLEGSVRRADGMVRVSAQLIDTSDGSTLWSERYDRRYQDLFALQDEITHAVAAALQAKLLPFGRAATQGDRPPGGSLDAYSALLQGRFLYSHRTRATGREAIKQITRATQIDPDYAAAWSELAQAQIFQAAAFYGGSEAREANAQARFAAERALVLAPQMPSAFLARGLVRQVVDFDWHGAESDFRQAATLAPNDALPKFYLGNVLAALGRMEESVEFTRHALASEPLRSNWYYWLAMHLYGSQQLDAAERTIRQAIDLDPAGAGFHETLTVLAVLRGDAQAALAAARDEADPSWQRIAIALATQIAGDAGAADAALRNVIAQDSVTSAFQIAQVQALRDDAQQTFVWLERAWVNRDPGVAGLLYDPFIKRFRNDPRFTAYCRKVGLPAPAEIAERNKPTGT